MNAMPPVAAVELLRKAVPNDSIVVTNQGSARIWPKLGERPLDLHYNPSTMGGAVPFALGLALAQPQREVFCLTGDGALLMSLGSLVSVIAAKVRNLTIVVFDNGLYEVTGGQRTPGAAARVDFSTIARGAGFEKVSSCECLEDWAAKVDSLSQSPGPRFIVLHVEPTPLEYLKFPTPPLPMQLDRFRANLSR